MSATASSVAARKKLRHRLATVQKQADLARKEAKLAKAGFKAAKQKFKEAKRAAKKHRKEIKALKAELATLATKKKRMAKSASRPMVKRKPLITTPAPVATENQPDVAPPPAEVPGADQARQP